MQRIYRAHIEHAETRTNCLIAFGRTRNAGTAISALNWMVNSGEVRGQDMFAMFGSMAHNRRYAS